MSLRSSRFYLFGYPHYYEHIRLPRLPVDLPASLGSPTFMRYLCPARNTILLRISAGLLFAITSSDITGFIKPERLTDTKGVTKLN
jgi:hypothetical protein